MWCPSGENWAFFVSVILPGIVHYLSARRDRELSSRAVVLQLELLSNTEVTSRPRILFKVTSEEKWGVESYIAASLI